MVVLESFTTRHGREKLREHQWLEGFASGAQPRSRTVFFNSEGNDLVISLDFSSLDVLEGINSKPPFFQGLWGASHCLSHRGLNEVMNC